MQTLQVAFTYMGTVVGAGFATGQEILQFFTRFGSFASLTIVLTTLLMSWLGTKILLMSRDIGAASYEDLNRYLFGDRAGLWISLLSMLNLFSVSAVMLAGAGSVFHEHLGLSYNLGLALTMLAVLLLLSRGITSIMAVNSLVVPVMLVYTVIVIIVTSVQPTAGSWLTLSSTESPLKMIAYAFLYVAGNLALAQAVLVPVGSSIEDRAVLRWGGWLGGIGIGFMLLAGHFALSAHMPGILRFEIPMGHTVSVLGSTIQMLVLFVIFAEIFTTLLSDVYGLTLQIRQHTGWPALIIIAFILVACYFISQIGFRKLLSVLYPLFGLISLLWLAMMFMKKPLPGDVR
jgi:uncharacterized membrane protein YkvI